LYTVMYPLALLGTTVATNVHSPHSWPWIFLGRCWKYRSKLTPKRPMLYVCKSISSNLQQSHWEYRLSKPWNLSLCSLCYYCNTFPFGCVLCCEGLLLLTPFLAKRFMAPLMYVLLVLRYQPAGVGWSDVAMVSFLAPMHGQGVNPSWSILSSYKLSTTWCQINFWEVPKCHILSYGSRLLVFWCHYNATTILLVV
jgi:hypothetical protein